MKTTALVIGASGGIGNHLVRRLKSDRNLSVLSLTRQKTNQPDVFQCDLHSLSEVTAFLKNSEPSTIFNLAGSFSGNFDTDFAANVNVTKTLLEAANCLELKPRIVIFGSAAEYGRAAFNQNVIDESSICRPESIYGLTKLMQTEYVLFHCRTFGSNVVIARLFNVIASGLSEKLFVGRLEKLVQQLKGGVISEMQFGSLDAIRDYVHIEVALDQILGIAKFGKKGEIYNVGSGRPQTMRQLLLDLLALENLEGTKFTETRTSTDTLKSASVSSMVADISKTSSLLSQSGQQ